MTPTKKLYVGNLPFSCADEDLKAMFEQVGNVAAANVIIDRKSGRSKGFGFVEMATDEEAASAIEQFNGAQYGGRPVTVTEAKPMVPREPRAPKKIEESPSTDSTEPSKTESV